jgi:hypothetical protein
MFRGINESACNQRLYNYNPFELSINDYKITSMTMIFTALLTIIGAQPQQTTGAFSKHGQHGEGKIKQRDGIGDEVLLVGRRVAVGTGI